MDNSTDFLRTIMRFLHSQPRSRLDIWNSWNNDSQLRFDYDSSASFPMSKVNIPIIEILHILSYIIWWLCFALIACSSNCCHERRHLKNKINPRLQSSHAIETLRPILILILIFNWTLIELEALLRWTHSPSNWPSCFVFLCPITPLLTNLVLLLRNQINNQASNSYVVLRRVMFILLWALQGAYGVIRAYGFVVLQQIIVTAVAPCVSISLAVITLTLILLDLFHILKIVSK